MNPDTHQITQRRNPLSMVSLPSTHCSSRTKLSSARYSLIENTSPYARVIVTPPLATIRCQLYSLLGTAYACVPFEGRITGAVSN